MNRLSPLFALAAVALMAIPAIRADDAAKPRTYAILVGVAEPGDAAIEARPAAEADAKAFFDLLTNPRILGIDRSNIRLLLGREDPQRGALPATHESIIQALSWVSGAAGKDDLIIVGIFGRGATAGDRTCFFSKGSTVKGRAKDALQAGEIETAVKPLKSEKLLVLLDIDYKGVTLDSKSVIEPSVTDFATAFVGDEDAEERSLPPGRVVIVASANVSRHLDRNGQGLFAEVALEALAGKADKEGYEPDGLVTVDELQKHVESQVVEIARQVGKTNEEKEQAPFLWGTRVYHFPVTRNPAIAEKNAARLAALSTLSLNQDIVDEGTRLIGRMPKLKAHQELRKQYVALADGTIQTADFMAQRTKILREMELDKDDAEAFARRTLAGLETVKRVYIKELALGDLVAWSVKGMYRGLEEKLPGDVADQLKTTAKMRRGQLADLLMDTRQRLGRREDLDKNKDVDLAMRSALFNLDPHSMYVSEDQIQQIQSRLLGQFTGIGVNVRRDMVRDGLLVISPIKDSPAHKAGVKAGDLITEIIRAVDATGNPISPPEITSTKGMKSDEAVRKIMGQPRTKVKIKVEREGEKAPLEFELARARIDVETVLGVTRKPDDSWDHWLDARKKIGYVRLTEFAPRSFEDMQAVVRKLHKDGMKGLILDLRFNPGGSLTAAVQISDMFIDDGLIVTVKPRSGVDDETAYNGKTKGSANNLTNFPMVCLVNGQSASASEIVSACLQDQQRATVFGERSFGKGSVQTIIDFPTTRAKLKLTTASFWRPNGRNLHKADTSGKDDDEWGVTPDEVIPLTREERIALGEQMREQEIIPNRAIKKETKPPVADRQLDAALKNLRASIPEEKAASAK